MTTETVTLYGLTLANDRVIGYERVDPDGARAWFITKALVEDAAAPQWSQRLAFLAGNADFLRGVRRMADRVRRVEIVDDEMLFDFYDQRVGREVTSTQHFDRWWKDVRRTDPTRFDLTDEFVADSLHLEGFPRRLEPARSAAGQRSGTSRSSCRSPIGTPLVNRSTA